MGVRGVPDVRVGVWVGRAVADYVMIPLYFYLSVYSYTYAAANYDLFIAPMLNFFVDYHADLVLQVEKERNRIRVLEQHGKARPG